MNAWTPTCPPIHLPTCVIDCLNALCELVILPLMLTQRAVLPRIVATQRHPKRLTEHPNGIVLSIVFHGLVPHSWPCEKMDTVFFSISRSCRVLSSSRLRRRFSSSNAVWCPLPGNASGPRSANSRAPLMNGSIGNA
jgi:hypothetical protein